MAKLVDDTVLDGAINVIKNATGLVQHLCNAQPTTRAEALTMSLANVALAAADVVAANGTTSGRMGTVAAKAAVPVTTAGTGNHVALISSTLLLYVTTCPATAVSAGGGTVDLGSWKFEIADPA